MEHDPRGRETSQRFTPKQARRFNGRLVSGGFGKEELEQVGAYRVVQDSADLLTHLDEAGVRITE
jgi:hypothetical protein